MAALEFRVLTKIIRERSLQEALKTGLSEKSFKDPEAKQVWRFLRRHWFDSATTKTVPTLEAVQRRWPSFHPTADLDEAALTALVHDLRCITYETDIRSLSSYFQELVDEDPYEAARAMQTHLTNLVLTFKETQHAGVGEAIDAALEHYDAAKKGIIYGIPWPWKCLTEDTLGKKPGDFVVFYARMKSMKTWLLFYCAIQDYIVNNQRVLIWSREMNKRKMFPRLAALMAGVDYQLFKKGRLPPHIYRRMRKRLLEIKAEDVAFQNESEEEREENARLGRKQLILMGGRDAPRDLDTLQGHIREFQPDVAYLDGWYHMECARMKGVRQRNERLAVLSEDVAQMAEDEAIPVVVSHQANRFGEKTYGNTMADLADTDVLAREADLIIRVLKRPSRKLHEDDYEVIPKQEEEAKLGRPSIKLPKKVEEEIQRKKGLEDSGDDDEDDVRLGTELALVLAGNRDGVLNALTINAIPGYNFEFISKNYSLAQVQEWLSQDSDDDKAPKSAPKREHIKPQFNKETFKNYKGP